MKRLDRWLTLFLLVLFGAMVAIAFQFPTQARLAPASVGFVGIVLCLVQLGFDVASAPLSHFAVRFHPAPKLGRPEESEDGNEEAASGTMRQQLVMWGYFLTFVALVLTFGFYVAVPALLFSYLLGEARVKWPHALMAGIGATAAMYLIFAGIFRFALFPGFVMPAALHILSR